MKESKPWKAVAGRRTGNYTVTIGDQTVNVIMPKELQASLDDMSFQLEYNKYIDHIERIKKKYCA